MCVVSDVKDTKFESNSQRDSDFDYWRAGCFWCQRYKIWKQFTTSDVREPHRMCCFWCQRYKIWKQFTTESRVIACASSCFWCQRYKIWKQFTTTLVMSNCAVWLFLMSKIQNLKAIHNINISAAIFTLVVSDVKDTRFERNTKNGDKKVCFTTALKLHKKMWKDKDMIIKLFYPY